MRAVFAIPCRLLGAWRSIVATVMIAVVLSGPLAETANANVGQELNDFFNSVGGAANVNGPAAYNGQSAGYYTGGSVWARSPQKNINPVNIQLPSVKAGCGGIDLFAGSFSFINADEFIAMLKATASNALGFAFQLAIKSISPQIAATIEELSQKAQQLNQFNMSSCEAAQGLVAGLWGKNQGRDSEVCKAIANSQGWATDWAKSRQDCNAGGQQAEMANKNKDKEGLPAGPHNYTWDMLAKSYPSFDKDFREYLMTLVGTIVYTPAENGTGSPTYAYFGQGDRAIMTALLDGGANAKVLSCDTSDACMKPTFTTLNISEAQALKPRVTAMIQSMLNKVRSNDALSAEEIGLLGATSIPLYKIITVNAAAQLGGMSPGDVDNLAEIVAVDMLETLLKQFYGYVSQGASSFQNADEETLTQWRQQIRGVEQNLQSETTSLSQRLQRTQMVLDRTVWLERTLRNSMSPQMSAALNFSQGLSAQGLQ